MDAISAKEAARILRCNLGTVYRWGLTGRIVAYRVGSKWEFDRGSVESFRRSARQTPPDLGPTPRQRRKHANAAAAELARMGYG